MHLLVSTWSIPPMTSHLCLLFLSSLTVSSPLGLDEIFFSPQDQTAREGATVFFPCVSGESSPPASISWIKDGKPVTRGRQIQGEYGGGNHRKTSGTLHLYNITLEDDGTYICITYNSLLNTQRRSKPAKLTVQGVPRKLQIINGPDNITVAVGDEVSMHCAVGGFPVPMVLWFKDGCLLTNCSASFSLQNNGQLLTFRNVTKEFEGLYHCEAYNQNERIKSGPGFLLLADMDWSFVQQPSNLTMKKGDNVTVTCRPPGSTPPAQVSWFKNNQLLTPTAHVSVLPTGDLYFHRIQEHDSGIYFCRVSNSHLQRFLTSRRAIVTVLAPPSLTLWPQLLTVPVGAPAVLECHVSGNPLPSIDWLKSGLSKQIGGRIIKRLTNATLYIQSARSCDEGVYVCHASNSLGQSQRNAVVKVAVQPIIVNFVSQVSCRIGASAVLPCRAVGIMPITYTWTKREGSKHIAITPSEEMYIYGEGSLHISRVHWSDEGEYYCLAKNRAGQHQKRSILTVTGDSSHCMELTESSNGHGTTPASFPLPSLGPYFVTQMPPPFFPPPPHPNFKFSSPQSQLAASSKPHYSKYLAFLSGPKTSVPERIEEPTQTTVYQSFSELPVTTFHSVSESESSFITQTMSVTLSPLLQIRFPNFYNETNSTQIHDKGLEHPGGPMHLKKILPTLASSDNITNYFSQDNSSPPPSQSQKKEIYAELVPTFSASTESTPLQIQSPLVPTQQPHVDSETSLPHIENFTINKHTSQSMYLLPTFSNTPTVNYMYNATTLSTMVNMSQQLNSSEEEQTLEKNTSQSPRVTQQAPSWLPVLEKHDIPIVVGVGVSLAFIFITVTFYSVVQKNEPVPTSRAAQRNLGVPMRHTGRRAYENRAFEDDDCVAVIEQSPNTSDTRARPPVMVQLEPTSEDQQEDVPPCLDLHSVTVETYPEPILDTKIDDGLSLSQPSIRLHCSEDWHSSGDDNNGPCQDTLPPPSPLSSPSPSPKHDEGLRSLLTLQSTELCATPIHHSLSISHGHPPLLLSHHVTLGQTNVAVDVQFHPVSTPSITVQSSTHINSVSSSTFTAPLVNSQESAHNK